MPNDNKPVIEDPVCLPDLGRAFCEMGFKPVSYSKLYRGMTSGICVTSRDQSNRWIVARKDLPALAEFLKLPRADEDADEGRAA